MSRLQSIIAVMLTFLSSLPVAAQPNKQDWNKMPVSPGVPIGCLLSPGCSGPLLTSGDGSKVTILKPVDPGKGVPCLADPKCRSTLETPNGQKVLFQRPVTIEQVASKGAEVGDYIPLTLLPSPGGAPPSSVSTDIVEKCTGAIVSIHNASSQAQGIASSDLDSKRASLRHLERSYRVAVETCVKLQP
jgi:hypothetical protein